MTYSLDLDDASVLNTRLDLLKDIKDHYPDFKVSLFFIPLDPRFEMSTQRMYRDKHLASLKENLDWIELIPHGITHLPNEFAKCDYYTFRDSVIPALEEQFEKDGLPFKKGFKAPYWLWNEGVVRALDEAGWFGATDRNQPDMLATKRNYVYTHSLEEPFYHSKNEVINLHGHVDGVSKNDLERNFLSIFKIPQEAEWKFASEFVKESE